MRMSIQRIANYLETWTLKNVKDSIYEILDIFDLGRENYILSWIKKKNLRKLTKSFYNCVLTPEETKKVLNQLVKKEKRYKPKKIKEYYANNKDFQRLRK